MNKNEHLEQIINQRKSKIKKIFSLFAKQPKAKDIITNQNNIITTKNFSYPEADSNISKQYIDFIYSNYLTKHSTENRIKEYYNIAVDPEINYALTEICDEIVQEEENDNIFKIVFDPSVPDEIRNIIIKEFKELIFNKLNLNNYNVLWNWVYKLLVQGVLVFKINFDKENNNGIYELEELKPWLIHQKTINPEVFEEENIKKFIDDNYYYYSKSTNTYIKYLKEEILVVDCGFVIDGEYFSILEFIKKDWRRLNLIEDSTVIYKLSRSPMRRIFKVYVGNMAPKDVENFLLSFRQRLREDIRYDPQKGEIVGFNPITILDDYFFPVFEGGQDSCNVEILSEKDVKWESMDEIRYFLGKIYRGLKIPIGRMNIPNESGESTVVTTGSRYGEVMRDEVKFSRFIKRLQNRFLEQFIKVLFLRHLFFRKLIDILKINQNSFKIKFTYVNPYAELKTAEVEEYRTSMFNNLNGSHNLISFIFLAKKYLKWTDEDLKENFKCLKKEQLLLNSTMQTSDTISSDLSNIPLNARGNKIPNIDNLDELNPENMNLNQENLENMEQNKNVTNTLTERPAPVEGVTEPG